jgi:hypothetical protein
VYDPAFVPLAVTLPEKVAAAGVTPVITFPD